MPGLHDLEQRRAEFSRLLSALNNDPVIIDSDLATALEKAQINREALVDLGLEFNRRRHGQLYFIS
ncbi:MAG: hypothetical protein KDC44_18490, partial [Phaeodactylibacter sp.]|nr:hypothetical protein [Phaeodactylibacter sp.]